MDGHADPGAGGLSSHRIEALTDGIYSVAMTLLVIDLKFPEHASFSTTQALADALLDLLPKVAAWAMSFFVLALFWIGHHRAFSQVQRCDSRLVWLNITQLAFVSLMPFSCDLLGEHGGSALAQAIYSGNMFSLALLALLIARHVHSHPALSKAAGSRATYLGTRIRVIGLMVISVVAVGLACLDLFPGAGSAAFAIMAVINPLSRWIERREHARGA